jgi:DNA (cytosine-5)-methyltransferase 1
MTETSINIKVLELFAGVGGFRVGLERANEDLGNEVFKVVWSNQWDPELIHQYASEIYVKHWGQDGHSSMDISKVALDDIPQADLLVAGFPCQDYSVATGFKGKGIDGKKGVLWWELAKVIEHNAPDYLLLENVDRLLGSPNGQKGRDFAIMLAKLNDLGYAVEWRVINAAEYGFPQKRKRVFIFGFKETAAICQSLPENLKEWLLTKGIFAKAFPHMEATQQSSVAKEFTIDGEISFISNSFGKNQNKKIFLNSGFASKRRVIQLKSKHAYKGVSKFLGDILQDNDVPEEFFIEDTDLIQWRKVKDAKKLKRKSKQGFEYEYAEGAISFPDSQDKPARTIVTSEGGKSPGRMKHIIQTKDGKFRRLTPVELERLNGFPDNHTLIEGISASRRAFLMGNALVTGIVQKFGCTLASELKHILK